MTFGGYCVLVMYVPGYFIICVHLSFQLLQRRDILYQKSSIRREKLEESYKFQMFERDCDETKIWINEKMKAASDENYLVSRTNGLV